MTNSRNNLNRIGEGNRPVSLLFQLKTILSVVIDDDYISGTYYLCQLQSTNRLQTQSTHVATMYMILWQISSIICSIHMPTVCLE